MAIKICIVSTKGGVGKSTLTANLGGFLADLSQRVLLIDADSQPTLSSYYKITHLASFGLTDFIVQARSEDVVSHTSIEGLHLIYSDDPDGNLRDLTKPLPDPHDTFFRETFSRREVAEDVLREYLPPELVQGIDWSSLEITKDSFVEKALRKHFSDLVYNVRYSQRGIKIYLLFEHKSRPSHWVALQLLRYQVRIWELHRKQHPGQPLPPIVPLVLYHGRQRWKVPEEFQALFGEIDPQLAAYVPAFRHELWDLTLPEPGWIRGQVLSRLILLALKHVFDPDPRQALAAILPLVKEILDQDTSMEMLEVVLRYYVTSSGKLDEQTIDQLLIETVGEDYMRTFIDDYIEQGRQKYALSLPTRRAPPCNSWT